MCRFNYPYNKWYTRYSIYRGNSIFLPLISLCINISSLCITRKHVASDPSCTYKELKSTLKSKSVLYWVFLSTGHIPKHIFGDTTASSLRVGLLHTASRVHHNRTDWRPLRHSATASAYASASATSALTCPCTPPHPPWYATLTDDATLEHSVNTVLKD